MDVVYIKNHVVAMLPFMWVYITIDKKKPAVKRFTFLLLLSMVTGFMFLYYKLL